MLPEALLVDQPWIAKLCGEFWVMGNVDIYHQETQCPVHTINKAFHLWLTK
jgi:hypothetical protein